MRVGDLVAHKFEDDLGIILQTNIWSNNCDYLVHFANKRAPEWYRKKYLEVISASR